MSGERFGTFYTQKADVPSENQLTDRTKGVLMRAPYIAFDIETDGERPNDPKYVGIKEDKFGLFVGAPVIAIGISWSVKPNTGVVLVSPFTKEELEFLRELFLRKDATFIAHNAIFDVRGLGVQYQIPIPENIFCTAVNAFTLGALSRREVSLFAQCASYGIDGDYQRWKDMKAGRENLLALDPSDLAWYVLEDARMALALYFEQQKLADWLVRESAYTYLPRAIEIDQAYNRVCMQWAVEGIEINLEYARSIVDDIYHECLPLEQEWILGSNHILSTNEQRHRYFFEQVGVESPDLDDTLLRTSTGRVSFGAKSLKHWMSNGTEEQRARIAEYEFYTRSQRIRAMVQSLIAHAQYDGKLHPMISIGTVTGRSSSSNPNVLNLPVGEPNTFRFGGKDHIVPSMRGVLRADRLPDVTTRFIEVDYSNAEVRFSATGSRDAELVRTLNSSDAHSKFAEVYFGEEWAELKRKEREALEAGNTELAAHYHGMLKNLRRDGKVVTFAMFYGAGTKRIAASLGVALERAQWVINNFIEQYPQTEQMKHQISNSAEQTYKWMKEHSPYSQLLRGWVTLWSGRRVPIEPPYFDAESGRMRSKWYKAYNTYMQAGVAELVKIVVIRVNDMLRGGGYKTRLVMQYHDALILSVAVDEADEVLPKILRIMQTVLPYEYCNVEGEMLLFTSDVNHYENAHKWGYDPYEEYPFPLFIGGDTDKPNVVAISEDEIVEEMKHSAIARLSKEIRSISSQINSLLSSDIPFIGYRDFEPFVDVLRNHSIDEIIEQAGKWIDVQRRGFKIKEEVADKIKSFIDLAQKLASLRREVEFLTGKLNSVIVSDNKGVGNDDT